MPNIVIPYKPRALQKILHGQIDKHRFSVIVLHRRAGKTVMAINHMLKASLTNKLLNPRYAFISPYRLQGKATAWDYIKQFAAKIPGTKFNDMTGVASQKEKNLLMEIPKAEIDAKFIAERTGGAVSEEELEMLKKLMSK